MDQRTTDWHEKQRAYYRRSVSPRIAHVSTPYVLNHIEAVVRFGNLVPGERVLDVGCGVGRHAFLLADRGLQVEGLDLSPDLLQHLREYEGGRYNMAAHCADIGEPPPELDARFDAVVGFFMLHHVPDLRQAFRGVARLLRPGGRAVFIEPNPYNPLYYLQVLCSPGMKWSAEKGMVQLRRRRILAAVREASLVSPVIERFGFFPPFLHNLALGEMIEKALDKIRPLRPVSAFQLIRVERAGV